MKQRAASPPSGDTPSIGPDASASAGRPPVLDRTIVKVFSLMELLASSEQPLGVSAIAQQLGLQKSNVHRLLRTLKVLGYVQQHPETSRYSPTLKTWEFGMKVAGRNVIKRVALPFMRMLQQQHHENVHLSVLVGTDILYLESINSNFPLRATTQAGGRIPAIFPASGKALLAYRPDAREIVAEVIRTHPQAAGLAVDDVLSELEEIRRRGYATSISGWRVNVNSVSAPILSSDTAAVAAVGISGPTERMPPEQLESLAAIVMNTAAQISEVLSSSGAFNEG
ncbi:MAG: IclR family transcriptional regulator [Pigmentiphaga sp.]|uniref:IclR family transcriptional regulator n=1 Tax=Pigmentiphaga sp. TaxID=1977564 RepID=UPI0029BD7F1E|nr:IclR family transcriptional regulator [Pigmentiphaga sp.]MDX3907029.1 IclR family transcriptional regulator [Pigmentiphaga sp.]